MTNTFMRSGILAIYKVISFRNHHISDLKTVYNGIYMQMIFRKMKRLTTICLPESRRFRTLSATKV